MNTPTIHKNKSGSIIHSGERRVIYNVFNYFKMSDLNVTMESTVIKTASACGVSENTVYKIIREQKETNTLKSPVTKRARRSMFDNLDEIHKHAIRRKINSIYLNNEYPTLDKIMALCETDEDIPNFKRTTLHKILCELGINLNQRDNRSLLIEREEAKLPVVEITVKAEPIECENLEKNEQNEINLQNIQASVKQEELWIKHELLDIEDESHDSIKDEGLNTLSENEARVDEGALIDDLNTHSTVISSGETAEGTGLRHAQP